MISRKSLSVRHLPLETGFKDTINPLELFVEKITSYVSLNSQFIVVLNGIICFSIRFCDNLLLELKMRFQVFRSFGSKRHKDFQMTGRY